MEFFNFKFLFSLVIICLSLKQQLTLADEYKPKIIIVGAGAAGIAAATKLVDDGFTDVTILEAKSRIGGRINTIPFGENVIDLGAQFECGEKGNVIYELASKENALDSSAEVFENYSLIRSNGELITLPIWKRLQNITDQVDELIKQEIGKFKGSLGEYCKQKYNELASQPEYAELDKKLVEEYYEVYAKESSSDEGTESIDNISAHDYANFKDCQGDAWMTWGDKGYIEALNLLMETKKTQKVYGKLDEKIQLSKPVIEIQWQRDDHKALLKTQEGTEYVADHVIVTVPLGVLKTYSKDLFEPNLPEAKQKAIDKLGFGLVNKIYIELKEPFWHPLWNGAYFLWHDEDLKEIRGTEREWLLDIYGFFTVDRQPNVLVTWIAGKGARHMEDLTEEQIKAGCLYLLNKFIPPDVKEIVNIKTSDWATDPCFFGAVSFHSLETEKANVDNDQLAEPIKLEDNKPILLFAGEATDHSYYSTVRGAVNSGLREAKRLSDYYKKEK